MVERFASLMMVSTRAWGEAVEVEIIAKNHLSWEILSGRRKRRRHSVVEALLGGLRHVMETQNYPQSYNHGRGRLIADQSTIELEVVPLFGVVHREKKVTKKELRRDFR